MSNGNGVVRRSRSVERALAVLSALAAAPEPMGVSDIARRVGLPKSTVHLSLQTMRTLGFVEQEVDTDRYGLGLHAAQLGLNAADRSRVLTYLSQPMQQLAQRSGEAVSFGIRQDCSVVFIQRYETAHVLSTNIRVGTYMPLHASATGKVILAAMSEAQLTEIYPEEPLPQQSEKSLRTRTELLAELAEVRRRGYARNLDEFHDGVSAAAVAVRLGADVVGGVSIAGPTVRFRAEDWIEELRAITAVPDPRVIAAGGVAAQGRPEHHVGTARADAGDSSDDISHADGVREATT